MRRWIALFAAVLWLGLPVARAAAAFEHEDCPMHDARVATKKRLPCHDSEEPRAERDTRSTHHDCARGVGVSTGACRCGAGDSVRGLDRDQPLRPKRIRLARVETTTPWTAVSTASPERSADPPEPPPPITRS